MAGVQAGNLIGGSVVVETVFGWPGIGPLAFNALLSRDLNLLLGIFFISACLVVVINLVVDLLYVMLDPRIELHMMRAAFRALRAQPHGPARPRPAALVVPAALLAPVLYPQGPFSLAGPPLQPPFGRFLLGTDTLGRDVARASSMARAPRCSIGLSADAARGAGRRIDRRARRLLPRHDRLVLMRLTEFFQTIPAFLFAILLVAILSPSIAQRHHRHRRRLLAAIARLVRGEFVCAAAAANSCWPASVSA